MKIGKFKGSEKEKKLLDPLPTDLPEHYLESVNTLFPKETLEEVRRSVNKSVPFGSDEWTKKMVKIHGLESTLRQPGRPRKE